MGCKVANVKLYIERIQACSLSNIRLRSVRHQISFRRLLLLLFRQTLTPSFVIASNIGPRDFHSTCTEDLEILLTTLQPS
jgi:hypothetical protein